MEVAHNYTELVAMLSSMGWTLASIKEKGGNWIAKAVDSNGEEAERSGSDPKFAVAALIGHAQQFEAMRPYFASWNTDWVDMREKIADKYQKAPVYDEKAAPAWTALANEAKAQADFLRKELHVIPTDDDAPYDSPASLLEDIRDNKRVLVSKANLDHPFWDDRQEFDIRVAMTVLGWAQSGTNAFDWEGANAAFQTYAPFLSEDARQALFAESVGKAAQDSTRGIPTHPRMTVMDDILAPAEDAEGEAAWESRLPTTGPEIPEEWREEALQKRKDDYERMASTKTAAPPVPTFEPNTSVEVFRGIYFAPISGSEDYEGVRTPEEYQKAVDYLMDSGPSGMGEWGNIIFSEEMGMGIHWTDDWHMATYFASGRGGGADDIDGLGIQVVLIGDTDSGNIVGEGEELEELAIEHNIFDYDEEHELTLRPDSKVSVRQMQVTYMTNVEDVLTGGRPEWKTLHWSPPSPMTVWASVDDGETWGEKLAAETPSQQERRLRRNRERFPNAEREVVWESTDWRVLDLKNADAIREAGLNALNCWQGYNSLGTVSSGPLEDGVSYFALEHQNGNSVLYWTKTNGQIDSVLGNRNKALNAGSPEHHAFLNFLEETGEGRNFSSYIEYPAGEPLPAEVSDLAKSDGSIAYSDGLMYPDTQQPVTVFYRNGQPSYISIHGTNGRIYTVQIGTDYETKNTADVSVSEDIWWNHVWYTVKGVAGEGRVTLNILNENHEDGAAEPRWVVKEFDAAAKEQGLGFAKTLADRARQDIDFEDPNGIIEGDMPDNRQPRYATRRVASVDGWTNWDTKELALVIESEYPNGVEKHLEDGVEAFADWAIENVIAPYNQQAMQNAREWNGVPEEERVDESYEEAKEDNPIIQTFGPNLSDITPDLIEEHLVNWNEVVEFLSDDDGEPFVPPSNPAPSPRRVIDTPKKFAKGDIVTKYSPSELAAMSMDERLNSIVEVKEVSPDCDYNRKTWHLRLVRLNGYPNLPWSQDFVRPVSPSELSFLEIGGETPDRLPPDWEEA